ncbi:MAG: hypothetical protein ACPG4T_01995 [Nannocystaceae bacterium]
MPSTPLLLRLPFTLVEQGFYFEKLLTNQFQRPYSDVWKLREYFLLSSPERQFVRRFLHTYRNWWLYRCNQVNLCGDFIAVDMSSPAPAKRRVLVIELKQHQALVLGGGGAGNQFQRAGEAVAELVATEVIHNKSPVTRVCGDQDVVLLWIAGGCV